MNMKYQQVLSI